MTIRTRTLKDGSVRWDVDYRDPAGRQTTRRGFTDPAEAAAFDALAHWAIRRWPLQPLLDRTGHDLNTLIDLARANPAPLRCAHRDGLTDVQADTLALAAGWHPFEIWGWEWVLTGLAFGVLDPRDPDPLTLDHLAEVDAIRFTVHGLAAADTVRQMAADQEVC